MIPKIIHYCWFGNKPKSNLALANIESWKIFNPEYKIIEWNEKNCDLQINQFVKEAYDKKKWAYVSDFFRVKAVLELGGFYLDTDMEITSNFDELLKYDCVCGFELKTKPFSAFFAAIPQHIFVNDMLVYYNSQNRFKEISNTNIFSKLLVDKYGVNPYNDNFQLLKFNIAIFPSTAFSLDIPKNYVIHHFEGSWLNTEQSFFKRYVNMYGTLNQLLCAEKSKESIYHLIYHNKIFTIEEIFDKIPLKFIFQYVLLKCKRKIFKK